VRLLPSAPKGRNRMTQPLGLGRMCPILPLAPTLSGLFVLAGQSVARTNSRRMVEGWRRRRRAISAQRVPYPR
jgi:hypothetical protein